MKEIVDPKKKKKRSGKTARKKQHFIEHSRTLLRVKGSLRALGGRWIHLVVAHAWWKGHTAPHSGDNITEGLSARLTCRHAKKAYKLCSFCALWCWHHLFYHLLLEGIEKKKTLRLVCKIHTKSTASLRQSSTWGQTGSQHTKHENLPPVFMSKYSVQLVLTDQELVQSSLTSSQKELSARWAPLRLISPCLMDFLLPQEMTCKGGKEETLQK